jgi:hypothetical protein
MPPAGGINAQLGYVDEVTPGTAVTVSRFSEFESESLTQDFERKTHSGLRTGRRTLGVNNYAVGRQTFEGDLELVMQTKGHALLTKHLLGSIATTTPGGATTARQHLAKVGDLDGKSMTVQVGMYDDTGTARAKTGAGCKVTKWELSGKESDFLGLKMSIDGMSSTWATAMAVASYPVSPADYFGTQCVVKIAGAEVECEEWTLGADNGLDTERYYMRSLSPGTKKESLEGKALRSYKGKVKLSFPDLTAHNRFVNNTVSSLQITYTGAIIEAAIPYSFDISMPDVRWDGSTPTVDGLGRIAADMSYTVVDSLAANGPVVLTTVNTDIAP